MGGQVNEMGEALFAHTSPIHLDQRGWLRFENVVVEELIAEMTMAREVIGEKGAFESAAQRD